MSRPQVRLSALLNCAANPKSFPPVGYIMTPSAQIRERLKQPEIQMGSSLADQVSQKYCHFLHGWDMGKQRNLVGFPGLTETWPWVCLLFYMPFNVSFYLHIGQKDEKARLFLLGQGVLSRGSKEGAQWTSSQLPAALLSTSSSGGKPLVICRPSPVCQLSQ